MSFISLHSSSSIFISSMVVSLERGGGVSTCIAEGEETSPSCTTSSTSMLDSNMVPVVELAGVFDEEAGVEAVVVEEELTGFLTKNCVRVV